MWTRQKSKFVTSLKKRLVVLKTDRVSTQTDYFTMKIGCLMQQGVDIKTPPFNGPANHVREVIQELKNLGHYVRVVVCLDGQIWISDNLELFEPVRVRWLDQGPIRWVERIVRRIQYELKLPYFAFF